MVNNLVWVVMKNGMALGLYDQFANATLSIEMTVTHVFNVNGGTQTNFARVETSDGLFTIVGVIKSDNPGRLY